MELSELPNIGNVIGGACLAQLNALEGAVEGISKEEFSTENKAELSAFFKAHHV